MTVESIAPEVPDTSTASPSPGSGVVWSQLLSSGRTQAMVQSGGGVIGSQTFSTSGARQLVSASTTAWAASALQPLVAWLGVDDWRYGRLAMYQNPGPCHLSLVPARRLVELPPGDHTVWLHAAPATITDTNDVFSLSVIDLGYPEPFSVRVAEAGQPATGSRPLYSTTFSSFGGTVAVAAAGSGWSVGGMAMIGMSVRVDGNEVGKAEVYANRPACHMAFVPVECVLTRLTPGKHTLELWATTGTTVDPNDCFSVSVLEITAPPAAAAVSAPIVNASWANASGPLTPAGSFSTSGGTLLVRAASSAWSVPGGGTLAVKVQIDGSTVGTISGFANAGGMHLPFATEFLLTGIAAGTHTISLSTSSGTTIDLNDRCSVSVMELAAAPPP